MVGNWSSQINQRGSDTVSRFCTSCGKPLGEGAKFCTGCGAAVVSVPTEVEGAEADISAEAKVSTAKPTEVIKEIKPEEKQKTPQHKTALAAKVTEKIKTKVKKEAQAYTKTVFSDGVPAYAAAGELALPMEHVPALTAIGDEGLLSVLKSGFTGLIGGFKRTLGDKKRLALVITLSITWLLVNVLAALGTFPLPVRLLSWLTAARGSLIGGTIGKGLVTALLAQVITDKGMFKALKGGLGQFGSVVKSGTGKVVPLLLGAGAALVACNIIVSTNLQNTMVCVAGFALSAKALTQNGFLRRFITGLLPKAKASVTSIMGGWTMGFALFAIVSILPGGRNGYLFGILLLIVGAILAIVNKNREGATA